MQFEFFADWQAPRKARRIARAAPAGRGIRLLREGLRVEKADIQALPFAEDSFDRAVIEAVTMFHARGSHALCA